MRKLSIVITVLLITLFLITACSPKTETAPAAAPAEPEAAMESAGEPDAITTASLVNSANDFMSASAADGTWIIAALDNITINREIVLEGEFSHRDEIYRKIALYAQDEDRNVTARYTLTAPAMVVRSPNTRIQGGTFIGDVYVEAPDFNLVDATIEGSVYFATEEFQQGFKQDEKSKVTGSTEVKKKM